MSTIDLGIRRPDDRRVAGFALSLLLLLPAGCDRRPREWTPLLDGSITSVVAAEMDEAVRSARAARASLAADPTTAGQRLDEALVALERLDSYYLPLLDVRERSHDAFHFYLDLERPERALEEVDAIERLLLGMAGYGGPALAGELEGLLETLADVRIAIISREPGAADQLLELAEHVHLMLLKADLVLE